MLIELGEESQNLSSRGWCWLLIQLVSCPTIPAMCWGFWFKMSFRKSPGKSLTWFLIEMKSPVSIVGDYKSRGKIRKLSPPLHPSGVGANSAGRSSNLEPRVLFAPDGGWLHSLAGNQDAQPSRGALFCSEHGWFSSPTKPITDNRCSYASSLESGCA